MRKIIESTDVEGLESLLGAVGVVVGVGGGVAVGVRVGEWRR
jgi:hypothetical protein